MKILDNILSKIEHFSHLGGNFQVGEIQLVKFVSRLWLANRHWRFITAPTPKSGPSNAATVTRASPPE